MKAAGRVAIVGYGLSTGHVAVPKVVRGADRRLGASAELTLYAEPALVYVG